MKAVRSRGYILIEMLLVVSLIAVFMLVAGKLLVVSINAVNDAHYREETAGRFDLSMRQLRDDVHLASSIEADGTSATIHESDGRRIVWRIEPLTSGKASPVPGPHGQEIRLSRRVERGAAGVGAIRQSAEVTQWLPLPAGLAFTADGPILRTHVSVDAPAHDPGSELTMMSQMHVLGDKP